MEIIKLWLKRLLLVFVGSFLGLLIIYGVARTYIVYADSVIDGDRAPYLQMSSADGMTVSWNTKQAEIGVVRYGLSPDNLEHVVEGNEASTAHEIRLTDLQPATRYFYAVGNKERILYGNKQDYWFRTSPKTGDAAAVRIWVLGDSGQPGPIADSTRNAMKEWVAKNPRKDKSGTNKPFIDQWLMLGDNAYRSGTNQQFQQAVFDMYPDTLRNVALWPAYGNHDARRNAFFKIFALPENAESGGVSSGTENYYSFNYANIHFVMLDSQDSDRDDDGEMAEWLRADLEANTQTWLIVAFHHPPYSKGSHDSDNSADSRGRLFDMRENILPILEEYGADLVLTGHSHVYERSRLIDCHYQDSSTFSNANVVSFGLNNNNERYLKPLSKTAHSGTIYIVAGASSREGNGSLDHPVMARSMLQNGSLLIDIEENKLTSRYINSEAKIMDEFSITKQKNYKSRYVGCAK